LRRWRIDPKTGKSVADPLEGAPGKVIRALRWQSAKEKAKK
jgi:hypothetical protein